MPDNVVDPNAPIHEFIEALNLVFARAEFKGKKFHDRDNPECYITEFYYDENEDKLYFKTDYEEE